MRWCSLQTNEHDPQATMYPIICKYHRLNISNWNKAPAPPGYICNRWQNMIVQPSQTHNHGKITQQWERWILQIGGMNYYLLFRVRSWNYGMSCMSLYILTVIEGMLKHFPECMWNEICRIGRHINQAKIWKMFWIHASNRIRQSIIFLSQHKTKMKKHLIKGHAIITNRSVSPPLIRYLKMTYTPI